MRNHEAELRAATAAEYLKDRLRIGHRRLGIVLGTGFGDKLVLEDADEVPLEEIPGFSRLEVLEGHARKYVFGSCGGKEVIALSGRIHLNEDPGNPDLFRMVRLQTEVMMKLGVERLIVTCAAGALPNSNIEVGNLVVIDGFVTLFAPQMPLKAGEFCSPEDALTIPLQTLALEEHGFYPGSLKRGGYAMVTGPFFEGRKYDKQVLANTGASIVGMSTLPEACIAALYPGVEMLALAFVTNDCVAAHSHEENLARAREYADGLGKYLSRVVQLT